MDSRESNGYSESCERGVLGALLLDPGLIPGVLERLDEADFAAPAHRAIYAALGELHKAGREVGIRSLLDQLGERTQEVGGVAYLAQLDIDLPDLGRLDTYVGVVKDRSRVRDQVRRLDELNAEIHQAQRPGVSVSPEDLQRERDRLSLRRPS